MYPVVGVAPKSSIAVALVFRYKIERFKKAHPIHYKKVHMYGISSVPIPL